MNVNIYESDQEENDEITQQKPLVMSHTWNAFDGYKCSLQYKYMKCIGFYILGLLQILILIIRTL